MDMGGDTGVVGARCCRIGKRVAGVGFAEQGTSAWGPGGVMRVGEVKSSGRRSRHAQGKSRGWKEGGRRSQAGVLGSLALIPTEGSSSSSFWWGLLAGSVGGICDS